MSQPSALFFDGKAAQRHQVHVAVGARDLVIMGASMAQGSWPLADTYMAAPPDAQALLILGNRRQPNARLRISDPEQVRQIETAMPALAKDLRRYKPWRAANWFTGVVAAICGVIGVGLALDGAPVVLAPLVPYQLEAAVGDRVMRTAPQYLFGRDCTNPAGREALDALVIRLAEAAGHDRPITLHVTNSKIPNAFAIPGGHVVLFHGAIDGASGPEEVAAVVAHEIGHVVARHSVRSLIRELGLKTALTLLTGGASGDIGGSMAEYGSKLVSLSYSRGAEEEADRLGIAMLKKAGLRADGLSKFFERAEKFDRSGGGSSSWLSTHPANEQRIAANRQSADGESPFTEAQWKAVKDICGPYQSPRK
jgi:Zn-dependent protease with chaperone function